MFGYEIVNLSPEQVAARRKQLDNAGLHAYLSPVLILLTIYAYRKLSKNASLSTPSKQKPTKLEHVLRRISWTLETTYLPEYGSLKAQLLCSVYTAWLLFLVVRNTGTDYMHVTKAVGHVGVSQLPLHYLLAIKSPNSPITKATGLAHERLNAYHRLLGRVIWLMLTAHGVLYLRFFALINVLADRLKNWVVIYGLVALCSINAIALLALPGIRQRVYHWVFYRSHVILSALLLIVIWLHVPYPRIYVGQAAFFWLLNGLLRRYGSEDVEATCEMVTEDLVRIRVPTSGAKFYDYVPGSHAYINDGGLGPRTPFTIVSVEDVNSKHSAEAHFIAKVTKGPMTAKFARAASQASKLSLSLEGPYGEAKEYMPGFMHEKTTPYKFLIVAGGVGATYALTIYAALLRAHNKNASVHFVWIVRSASEALWGLKALNGLAMLNPAHLYVTSKVSDTTDVQKIPNVLVKDVGRRPDLDLLVDSFLSPKLDSKEAKRKSDPRKVKRSYEPVVIMSCGPSALIKDLRNAAGRHVSEYGRDVRWYEEQFGFGGS